MSATATKTRRHPRNPDYPPRVVEFAKRLVENGYTAYGAQQALAKRGYHPSASTIKRWTDPDFAEATRRGRRRGGKPGPRPHKTWRRRLERMQELRELGISFRSIAALMSHDFDLELTEHQVRSIFKGETSQRTIRKLLWPQGADA